MIIEMGEWLPDLTAFGNPGALTARNVIPTARGYIGFPQQQTYSDALTGRAQGAIGAKSAAGAAYNYAGDETTLSQITASGVSWTDSSRTVGGAYATVGEEYWEFAKWKETVIATNFTDDPQTITFGGANFSALTTAVKFKHIAVVGDFVVAGNTSDGADGHVPYRVRWPAINDPTAWTVSASTLADFQDLPGRGGAIQAVTGGSFGVVVAEESIHRMSFTGSPTVFQFDEIFPGVGTLAPQSVRRSGRLTFLLAQDGFRVIVDGSTTELIGANKVDRTFFNELDSANIKRVFGAVDPINNRVFWTYPASGSSGGTPNKIIAYDIPSARWSFSDQAAEMLWLSVTGGQTLESLDNISSSLDALTQSLDSSAFSADTRVLSAFSTDKKMTQFLGTAQNGEVDTGEVQLIPGRRARVQRVRPMVDTDSTATVTIGARSKQGAVASFGSAASLLDSGATSARSNARYHRFRINTSGQFKSIFGVDVEATPSGRR